MFCKHCGKEVDNDSLFCSYCGLKLAKGVDGIDRQRRILLANQKEHPVVEDIYDETYEKETTATIAGVVFILITLILYSFPIDKYITPTHENNMYDENSFTEYKFFFASISIFFRVIITIWVTNIATRQNRSRIFWGICAFVFPSISLIIIGLMKKIK